MRLRIKFAKTDAMRYIGHLDLFRAWERTFRRSGLPLAYSLGFHPQPRLNLACALPLGFTSECELVDAWLEVDLSLAEIRPSIETALPPGLSILDLLLVDNQLPALQTQVQSAVYLITFLNTVPDLAVLVNRIISAEHLPRQRRGKPYDLRALVEQLEIIDATETGCSRLRVQLAAREAATGRPEELLDEMDIKLEDTWVHREKLIIGAS
jgi:radical SAM-linked protein